jgi:[protein-PII] uridylyltransferase
LNILTDTALLPFDINTLIQMLRAGGKPLLTLRRVLKTADEELRQQFASGVPVETLVQNRTRAVDALISHAYELHLPQTDIALIAVGGYGRGELHPHSDVDLLILWRAGHQERLRDSIERFIAFLWDIGLYVSHSVRTLKECTVHAQRDVTIATNLMETRKLAGDETLYTCLCNRMTSSLIWPPKEYLIAKLREQRERHAKYQDTAYRLEPDVKDGPGGLRDIQMIGWVAKRHFSTSNLYSLLEHGFLTQGEFEDLRRGRSFLWKIRFALHILNGRCEDRLQFDSQVKLAKEFGYHDAPESLAVEQFMQDYYQTIKELGLLNEMLLQLLQEAILCTDVATSGFSNDSFEERGGFLYLRFPELFAQRPAAMLELFLILEQYPTLKGVSASTLRSLRANLQRLDATFRDNPPNRELFMRILREPHGVTHELRRMNRYGVLGKYLPAFGRIVGRMQYDLFHAYTVDEHILFVIANLRRFALARYDREFPLCSKIMQALPKPELAYLGALFHDVAKGRGGDHSTLGADEAQMFCRAHGLSPYDARMVSWLVQNHLLLSLTAQKKDIDDPQVVHAFATQVGDQMHLDYLYVLTVADIRGTNPALWNSWKASLCVKLYLNTTRALLHGLEKPIDKEELIKEIQHDAMTRLYGLEIELPAVQSMWESFSEEYFLHHSPEEIAWHATCLAGRPFGQMPLVFLRQRAARGGTAVCIYSVCDEYIFGRVTAALAELGLTILDAHLTPMSTGIRLDTYVVLEDNGEPILETDRLNEIEALLRREINRRNAFPGVVTRRAPRQVRMFSTPTLIQFAEGSINDRTILEISAGDRPGLLSLIGQTLAECEVHLRNAKITTVGERAEDVFFISDCNNQPIDDPVTRQRLRKALFACLGDAG